MFDWSDPDLDSRLEGAGIFDAIVGPSDHYFVFSQLNTTFNGLQFYSWNSNPGDTLDFYLEYEAAPDVWLRYKKVAKSWYMFPNVAKDIILFPAKPPQGFRCRFKYTNVGSETVKFAVNVFKFIPTEQVNPLLGEQGEDW